MSAEDLLIRIDATTEQLRRELQRADQNVDRSTRMMDRHLRRVDTAMDRLNRSAQRMGLGLGALAGYFSVRQVSRWAGEINTAADEVGKLSTQLDLSTDRIQEYQFAAELSGVSTSDLQNNLARLTRRIGEARQGTGEFARVARDLGISVNSTEEAFNDVADAIQRSRDANESARIAQAAFGQSGRVMVRMLRDGSDGLREMAEQAHRSGRVMREEAIDAIQQYNDNMHILRGQFRGIANDMMTAMMPALADVTEALKNQALEADRVEASFSVLDFTVRGLASVFIGLRTVARATGSVIENLGEISERASVKWWEWAISPAWAIGRLVQSAEASKDDLTGILGDINEELLRGGEIINQFWAKIDQAERERRAQRQRDRAGPSSADNAAEILNQQIERQIDALIRQASTLGMSARETALWTAAQQDANEAQLATINMAYDMIEAWEAQRAEQRRLQSMTEDVDQLRRRALDDQTRALEDLRDQYQLLQEAVEAGLITQEEAAEVAGGLAERYAEAMEKAKRSTQDLNEFAVQAARNIQNAFADFLFDPFEDGLEGMVSGFADALRRMVANLLAQQMLMQFFGGLSGSSNPILAGMGVQFGGGRWQGGAGQAGKTYLAGEQGPELVHLGASAHFTPNHRLGGEVNVNVINNTPVQISRRERRDGNGGKSIELIIDEAVSQQIARPGSNSHRAMRGTFALQRNLVQR